jgi:glycosyl hydrolase family 76
LVGAVVCVAVVAIRAAQLGAPASEFHLSPTGLEVSTAYQDAVARCQHLMPVDHHSHYCGELAYGPPYEDPPTVARAARMGVAELADARRGVNADLTAKVLPWQWIYASGLWGGHLIAHWWQSALALRTLLRYLELTHNTNPGFQTILMRIYDRERTNPFAIAYTNFANMFGDDTAWWGLAWLEASKYELNVRHDLAHARAFLGLARYDANYLDKRARMCGGVEWKIGYPPDTITGAEYASLVGGLYSYEIAQGPLQDTADASRWLTQARDTIAWLERKHLINVHTGSVRNGLQVGCRQLLGGPLTYTQGQVADALIQLGTALHDRTYYRQANTFLRYTLSQRAGFVNRNTGILQEKCERDRTACTGDKQYLDILSWKGILMQALQDYGAATGSTEYDAFILRQATAIVHNSIRQSNGSPGRCDTADSCQFVFYWGWPLSPARSGFVNQATQMDAIDALTAALAVNPSAA